MSNDSSCQTKIYNLIEKWEMDIETYPTDTMLGEFCRAVLRCCIRELQELYDACPKEVKE